MTLLDSFYIICKKTINDSVWYMLVEKETQHVLSAGNDLEVILKVLKKYVKKYRTQGRLLKALKRLNYGNGVPKVEYEQRLQDYKEYGEDYADLVREVVIESLKEAREEDKENSPIKQTAKRLKKGGLMMTKSTIKKEEVKPQETVERTKSTLTPKSVRRINVIKR